MKHLTNYQEIVGILLFTVTLLKVCSIAALCAWAIHEKDPINDLIDSYEDLQKETLHAMIKSHIEENEWLV